MTAPLLKVEGLKVAYGRIEAVRHVDLVVHRGECVGASPFKLAANSARRTNSARYPSVSLLRCVRAL